VGWIKAPIGVGRNSSLLRGAATRHLGFRLAAEQE
jgi:hypothetical protein